MYQKIILLKLELARLELKLAREKLQEFEREFQKDFRNEHEYRATVGAKTSSDVVEGRHKVTLLTEDERQTIQPLMKELYRQMAIKFHPDKNPDNEKAEERFKQCTGAYHDGNIAKIISLASEHAIDIPEMNDDAMLCLTSTMGRCMLEVQKIHQALSWTWCHSNKTHEFRRSIHRHLGIDTEEYELWLKARDGKPAT